MKIGGVDLDELKEINHTRAYNVEVYVLDKGSWYSLDDVVAVGALTAEKAREELDPDWVKDMTSPGGEDGEPQLYEAARIAISPRGVICTEGLNVYADDEECTFFVY